MKLESTAGSFYSLILAVIAGALALIVIFGWYLHLPALIQILPELVPMQFNTGLSFILLASAIVLYLNRYLKISYLMVGSVLVLAGLTLIEYIYSIDMGIDELFIDHYITTQSPNPGRMSVNTALCFFITSAVLLLRFSDYEYFNISLPLNAFVASVGAISLLGYLVGIESAYSWASNFSAMAMHTSLCFVLLSVSIFFLFDKQKVMYINWAFCFASFITMLIIFYAVSVFVELKKSEANFKAELDTLTSISQQDSVMLNYLPAANIFLISLLILAIITGAFVFAFITSLFQARELKSQSQALIAANAELEEFAYRTSHDLRSPLNSSIKLIALSQRFATEGDLEKSSLMIDTARQSLIKLETLVKDILSITKTKNAEEETTLVDIPNLIEDSIQKFSHMDGFNRMNIEKTLEFKGSIEAKESRVRLIVENLISNAIKYADLQKPNSFLKISIKKDGKQLIMAFEDNGLGVPKHKQKELFRMFQRFHPKAADGSGLGLYMIKKSADILNGKIEFKETINGSCFSLNIPII